MFFILQVVAIGIAVSLEHPLAPYAACVLPVLYIAIMAPGVFTGGSNISLKDLEGQLSTHWANADELATYMKRYWFALRYAMSAGSRQSNCTFLSFLSFGTGVYFFFGLTTYPSALILCVSSVVLYLMAMRVNRPLGILNDPKFRNSLDERFRSEWRLAATSLVAFSELFPESKNHKFLADVVLNDEVGKSVVENWRVHH